MYLLGTWYAGLSATASRPDRLWPYINLMLVAVVPDGAELSIQEASEAVQLLD